MPAMSRPASPRWLLLLSLLACADVPLSPIPTSDWRLASITSAPALSAQELGSVSLSFAPGAYATSLSGEISAQTLCNRYGAFYVQEYRNHLVVTMRGSTPVGCG